MVHSLEFDLGKGLRHDSTLEAMHALSSSECILDWSTFLPAQKTQLGLLRHRLAKYGWAMAMSNPDHHPEKLGGILEALANPTSEKKVSISSTEIQDALQSHLTPWLKHPETGAHLQAKVQCLRLKSFGYPSVWTPESSADNKKTFFFIPAMGGPAPDLRVDDGKHILTPKAFPRYVVLGCIIFWTHGRLVASATTNSVMPGLLGCYEPSVTSASTSVRRLKRGNRFYLAPGKLEVASPRSLRSKKRRNKSKTCKPPNSKVYKFP
jgi:hypothetical protein